MLVFGPFQLDPDRREILRNGERFPLQARPFDTLVFLVQHRDRVVDKQELLENVWPDAYVEESALFQTISTLRKALGEGKPAGERYIATVPGRGYRFVADVALSEAGETGSSNLAVEAPGPLQPQPTRAKTDLYRVGLRRGIAVVATVAAAATLGAVLWPVLKSPAPDAASTTVTRLTSLEGVEWQPGWSPDGRSIAYSGTAFGSADIFVTAAAGGDPLRRTFDAADDLHPRWSPTGRYIAFLSDRGQGLGVYVTSPYEGPERKIAETRLHRDVGLLSGLGAQPWSPDGGSLLFPRRHEDGSIAVWRIELSTGVETQMTFPPPGSEDREASWSFDGRKIAFQGLVGARRGLWVTDADGRNEKRVAEKGRSPAWSPDGRALYVTQGDPINIWRLELDSGEWSQVTVGAGQDLFPAVAATGRLAYSNFRHTLHLYRIDIASGSSEQLTTGTSHDLYARVSPDGTRVAYQSDRSGNADIWVRDLGTGEELRLTEYPGPDTRPDWSPDGNRIVFVSNRDGGLRLCVVEAGGGAPQCDAQHTIPNAGSRTAAVEGNAAPRWSPDGERIGYIAPTKKGSALWLATLDGKAEPVASTEGAVNFGWYLDRNRVVVTRIGNNGDRETVAMNLETGQRRLLQRGLHYELEIAADGSAFSYCDGISHANQNLFLLRLSPPDTEDGLPQPLGEPMQLTDGKGVWHVHNGGWSPDGQSIIHTRDTDQADIFLVGARGEIGTGPLRKN